MDAAFTTHKLNDEGFEKARDIALAFDDLLKRITGLCTQGREFALVRTSLETACFYAKKAMAVDPKNQKQD
jgi:hypothetical protein